MIELSTALVADLRDRLGRWEGTETICTRAETLFLAIGDRIPLRDLGALATAASLGMMVTVTIDGLVETHPAQPLQRLAA